MASTARFNQIVASSGKPSVYLTWSAPEKDPAFKRALKENRVLSVHQELRGGKKDFGSVGFINEAGTQYLIFPKSLRKFADKRVIGIDYTLFEGELQNAAAGFEQSLRTPPKPRSKSSSRPVERKSAKADVVAFPRTEKPIPLATPLPPPPKQPAKPPAAAAPPISAKGAQKKTPTQQAPKASAPVRIEIKRAIAELGEGKTAAAIARLVELI